MKYAVIRIKGNQYKVKEGESLLVDKLVGEIEPEVLLVANEGEVKVGKPVLSKVKLNWEVEEANVKGEKITVRKFKAKSRYRKTTGSRASLSRIKINKITS